MSRDKTIIAISGPEDFDKRLLARFITQELRRVIGWNDTNLTLNFDGAEKNSSRVHEGDVFEHMQDRPIELYIPLGPRLVSYELDDKGNPAKVVVGVSAVDEHSFRGVVKKTAQRLHEALVYKSGLDYEPTLTIIDTDIVGEEIRLFAIPVGHTSLADMVAGVVQRVRDVILDAP